MELKDEVVELMVEGRIWSDREPGSQSLHSSRSSRQKCLDSYIADRAVYVSAGLLFEADAMELEVEVTERNATLLRRYRQMSRCYDYCCLLCFLWRGCLPEGSKRLDCCFLREVASIC